MNKIKQVASKIRPNKESNIGNNKSGLSSGDEELLLLEELLEEEDDE
jgi:hypothetical protein